MDLTEHFALKTMPFRPGSVAVTNAIMAANEIAAAVRQGARRILLVGAPGSGLTTTINLARDKISAAAPQHANAPSPLDMLDEADRLPPGELEKRLSSKADGILVAAYGGEPDADVSAAADKLVKLRPMSPVDAAVYLRSAIETAGGDPTLLSREAVSELVRSGGGSLRQLRALVGRSMVEAMVAGETVVTAAHVEAAKTAGEIEERAGSGESVQPDPESRTDPEDLRAEPADNGAAKDDGANDPAATNDERADTADTAHKPKGAAAADADGTAAVTAPFRPLTAPDDEAPPRPAPTAAANAERGKAGPATKTSAKRGGIAKMVIGGAAAGAAAALAAVLLLRGEPAAESNGPERVRIPAEASDVPRGQGPLALPDMSERSDMSTLPPEGEDENALDRENLDGDEAAETSRTAERSDDTDAADRARRDRAPRTRQTAPSPPRTSAAQSVRAVVSAPRTANQGRVRPASVKIYYVDGNEASEDRANDVARALRLNGWDVDSVDDASFPIRAPSTRFFNRADKAAANELGAWLQGAMPGELGDMTPQVVDMTAIAGTSPGEIEILVP